MLGHNHNNTQTEITTKHPNRVNIRKEIRLADLQNTKGCYALA